jgi:predicted acyltransferase
MLFTLGLGTVISVAVAVPLNIGTLVVSVLFCIVLITAIYKDSRTPKTSYAWVFIGILLGMRLSSMVDNQSSFIFGLIYILALCLAVYSAWQLYLGSGSENEASK